MIRNKFFLMKHKILPLILITCCYFQSFSQEETKTINNDVFVTNEVSINTDQLEFSPTFFEDGILFISTNPVNSKFKVKDKRIDKNIMSIFRSVRDKEGKLQKPTPFALELLSTVHEGPVTLDRTAENIYFTRNNYQGKKLIKGADGIVKLQVYSAKRMDNVWKDVEKLPFNDKNSNAAHPSVSVENDQLYFTSDRPGGQGGMDLYMSVKENGSWSEPINLGPSINTSEDEVFPFIHADGTLYFSSKGHSSMGGLDLYTVQQVDGEWGTPENMGTPFNSEMDDFGIIIDRDKKNGYFSSSRNGGVGQDDIYSFFALDGLKKNKEEEDFEKSLMLSVTDEEEGTFLEGAVVTYMKLDELTLGKAISDLSAIGDPNAKADDLVIKLPIDERANTGFTDSDGKIPLTLNRGNYVVKVEKNGYLSKQLAINSEGEVMEYLVALVKDDGTGTMTSNGSSGNGNSGNGSGNDNINGTAGNGSGNDSGSGSGTGLTGDPFIDSGVVEVSTDIKEGTVIELPNIYYNFNDASIRPDAQQDLDDLATFLNRFPGIEIELISHTDARGGDRYNRRLSQRRAEKAVDYLVTSGVERGRITPRGEGENSLRNDCDDNVECTEAEHQYNRRTEVRITKIDAPIVVKFVNNYPSYISEAPSSVKYSGRNSSSDDSSFNSDDDYTPVDGDDNYNPDGRYKVVAGAFANINNAEKRLVQVRELGYNNADILKFGTRGLFHVVVSRYSSSSDAAATVRNLKSKSVRAFVKI